jgi:hypothetical protein
MSVTTTASTEHQGLAGPLAHSTKGQFMHAHDVHKTKRPSTQYPSPPIKGGRQPQGDVRRSRPPEPVGAQLVARTNRANRIRRRQRLVDEDLRLHGSLGIRALLDGLELDYGIPDLDRRLERLADADPRAIALLELAAPR